MPPHKIGAIGRSNGKEVRMFFPSQASMVECLTMNEQGATEIMALDELLNQYANEIDDNAVTIKNTSILIDATATYKSGAFTLTTSQQIPFGRYILRFIAPENYHTGDVLQIGGKDFEVVTVSAPDTPAPDGIFAKGALVTLDVDGNSAKAFFKGGSGGGDVGIRLHRSFLTRPMWEQIIIPGSRYRVNGVSYGNEVISAGGGSDSVGSVADAFNPITRTIRTLVSMTVPRIYPVVGCVDSGEIICAVGQSTVGGTTTFTKVVDAINPVTNTLRRLVDTQYGRSQATGTAVGNELIIIGGQEYGVLNMLAVTEAVNAVTNTKRNIVSLSVARKDTITIRYGNEIVVSSGATTNSPTFDLTKVVDIINPVTNIIRSITLPVGVAYSLVGIVGNEYLIVGGRTWTTGQSSEVRSKAIYSVNLISGAVRKLSVTLPVECYWDYYSSGFELNGKLVVMRGGLLTSMVLIDPINDTIETFSNSPYSLNSIYPFFVDNRYWVFPGTSILVFIPDSISSGEGSESLTIPTATLGLTDIGNLTTEETDISLPFLSNYLGNDYLPNTRIPMREKQELVVSGLGGSSEEIPVTYLIFELKLHARV